MGEYTPEGLPVIVDQLIVSILDTKRTGRNFSMERLLSDEVFIEVMAILENDQPNLHYIIDNWRLQYIIDAWEERNRLSEEHPELAGVANVAADLYFRGMCAMYKLLREQAIANQLEQNHSKD